MRNATGEVHWGTATLLNEWTTETIDGMQHFRITNRTSKDITFNGTIIKSKLHCQEISGGIRLIFLDAGVSRPTF